MEQAPRKPAKRVQDSVELYTVKCINCEKWRLVPSKEKYEQLREKIEERPFSCETAQEWRPELSSQDDGDIEQDEHLGWAMDRPNIPQTPPGWQRIIRIRAGTKFADIYYVSPSNKRLRSMAELNRYLDEHPEYKEGGVNTSRFSFQAPHHWTKTMFQNIEIVLPVQVTFRSFLLKLIPYHALLLTRMWTRILESQRAYLQRLRVC